MLAVKRKPLVEGNPREFVRIKTPDGTAIYVGVGVKFFDGSVNTRVVVDAPRCFEVDRITVPVDCVPSRNPELVERI